MAPEDFEHPLVRRLYQLRCEAEDIQAVARTPLPIAGFKIIFVASDYDAKFILAATQHGAPEDLRVRSSIVSQAESFSWLLVGKRILIP